VVTRFRTSKTASLLAYLALYPQRPHPREELIERHWPECEPSLGRRSLRTALSSLRRQLEPPDLPPGAVIRADRQTVGLTPGACVTDVAEFEAALQSAARTDPAERMPHLVRAVNFYQGKLLRGYTEAWIDNEQQRLDELFVQAALQLCVRLEASGDLDGALHHARRATCLDPLREEPRGEVIRLLAAAGQSGAALRQYQELEQMLREELNATPDPALCQLVESIRSRAPADPSAPPPPVSPGSCQRLTNSPRPLFPVEPVGGAVPLDSPFYVRRPADEAFGAAIERRDSIVLVKGTRQVGKTSLLARGLQRARQCGALVVLTDLDQFNGGQLATADSLLLALAETIAEQLGLEGVPEAAWAAGRGANPSFRRFLRRHVLGALSTPLVWGLDQVDRLFPYDYASELFALFRSWHNARVLDPEGPWSRFTLALSYATEVHLFITDVSRSPFNVGTRVTLEDFTPAEVADLNRRYASPLRTSAELDRYYRLVCGHPYLVRRGLHELAAGSTSPSALEARAAGEEWIFGDHLHRMLSLVTHDADLCEAVRGVLQGKPCPTLESFYRLRSAGVLTGDSPREAKPRCELYARYLQQHLP
jgi:DNA-binding SARP family transcriptional activator